MTKGERDFNNFLLTPLDMPMEGKYNMPMIKGMVMKNFKAPENFVEFHSATKGSWAYKKKITKVTGNNLGSTQVHNFWSVKYPK